jgi:hypothetical protein
MSIDHGELNVPLAKRYGRGGIDAAIDRHLAAEQRKSTADWKARRKAQREAEAARVRLTAEDLAGVTHVRDSCGWHKVVRVNAKTVTVETGYSWTDALPIGKILEGRTL